MSILNINYVSTACGTGKSTKFREYIAANPNNKYLIVLPTIELGNEFKSKLEALNVRDVYCINEKTKLDSQTVSNAIEDKLIFFNGVDHNDEPIKNCVLIITHESFKNGIKWRRHVSDWELYLDEIIATDGSHKFTLPNTTNLFTDFINPELDTQGNKIVYGNVYRLIHNPDILSQHQTAKNQKRDDIVQLVQDMETFHDAFVDIEEWTRIVDDAIIIPDDAINSKYGNQKNTIIVSTMLNPNIFNGFKSVNIMCANFEQTMLYQWFKKIHEVNFVEHRDITDSIKIKKHTNGHRIKALVLSEKFYSIHQRNKALKEPEFINGVLVKTIGDKLGMMTVKELKCDFGYTVNNDFTVENGFISREQLEKYGIKIDTICYGRNDWMNIKKAYCGVALNKTPEHIKNLKSLGFTSDEIKIANICENNYQTVCRTSIRTDDESEVIFLFSDMFTAKIVMAYWENAPEPKYVDGAIMNYVPLTQTEKDKRVKSKKLIGAGFNGSAIDLIQHLSKIATNNIKTYNESFDVLPNVNTTDYNYIVMNINGDPDDFRIKANTRKAKFAAIVYDTFRVNGYTAIVFLKHGTNKTAAIEAFKVMGFDIDGSYLFAPSQLNNEDFLFEKLNCSESRMLEKSTLEVI
jgi:hypothetical protein